MKSLGLGSGVSNERVWASVFRVAVAGVGEFSVDGVSGLGGVGESNLPLRGPQNR